MTMSKRHQSVEAEFLRLPAACRIPAVYTALCRVGKIREVAVKNRLSAIKLFRAELLDEEQPANTKKKKPTRAPAEAPVKKKREWNKDYEPVAGHEEEDDEEDDETPIEDQIDG